MVMALDYETIDSRGASFEYFRKDFMIYSMALSWRDDSGEMKQWFSKNQGEIYRKLVELNKTQVPLVVHNRQFEVGVTNALHPELNLNFQYDTMRLCKLRDSGGEEFTQISLTEDQEIDIELGEYTIEDLKKDLNKQKGLSLEACARRFLPPQNQDHKKVAHDWLKEHHGITNHYGRYLHLLPEEQLRQYNLADTDTTLLLCEECIRFFKEDAPFDFSRDQQLYNMRTDFISRAYVTGIKVAQEELFQYILDIEKEIDDIDRTFMIMFKDELRAVRKELYKEQRDRMLTLKTKKGQDKRWTSILEGKYAADLRFNLNSNSKHLPLLFETTLGIEPKFRTNKGAPSFKSTHLHQWGKGGEILVKRKKRQLVLGQAVAIYVSSLYDGKLHPQVKADGTRTNRVSGGR